MTEPQWLGRHKPHAVIDAQGHFCRAYPSGVAKGNGFCRTCAGQDPVVRERVFRDGVAKLGGRVTEPIWLGNQKSHRIICGAGHETTVHPRTIERGYALCRICSGRDPVPAMQAFRVAVEALGGRVVEPRWLGLNVPHRVTCSEGHECRPRPVSLRSGQGMCVICAGTDPATAWRAFIERVRQSGGRVIESEWLGSRFAHRVICREGHETTVHPSSLQAGQGICRFCASKSWDVFYVVANDAAETVKFGITSNNPARRLRDHRADGYKNVVLTITDLPDASDLERAALSALRLAEVAPVRGREYYDLSALPVILDIADNWVPSERGLVKPAITWISVPLFELDAEGLAA